MSDARRFLEDFWPGQEISAAAIAASRSSEDRTDGYLEAIQGRMAAEGAASDSDSEIDRCLAPCVCGPLLVNLARFFREEGYDLLRAARKERYEHLKVKS